MKVIAIQIEGSRMNIVILEKSGENIIDKTGTIKYFELAEDHESSNTKKFMNVIHRHFDSIDATKIGIIKRNANAKGVHKPSPISFKIEALIQLYDKQNVLIVPPQSISAYQKRNSSIIIKAPYKYQQEAYQLGYYLIYN